MRDHGSATGCGFCCAIGRGKGRSLLVSPLNGTAEACHNNTLTSLLALLLYEIDFLERVHQLPASSGFPLICDYKKGHSGDYTFHSPQLHEHHYYLAAQLSSTLKWQNDFPSSSHLPHNCHSEYRGYVSCGPKTPYSYQVQHCALTLELGSYCV